MNVWSPAYWMTSSARGSSDGGIVRPRAFNVCHASLASKSYFLHSASSALNTRPAMLFCHSPL